MAKKLHILWKDGLFPSFFQDKTNKRLPSWTQGCTTKDLSMHKDLPTESYSNDTQLLLAKALWRNFT